MTTIARKVLNQNTCDNMTLERLVDKSGYQIYYPLQIDQDRKNEKTAYIFEDGSALINKNNDWRVIVNYGLHADNECYSPRFQ